MRRKLSLYETTSAAKVYIRHAHYLSKAKYWMRRFASWVQLAVHEEDHLSNQIWPKGRIIRELGLNNATCSRVFGRRRLLLVRIYEKKEQLESAECIFSLLPLLHTQLHVTISNVVKVTLICTNVWETQESRKELDFVWENRCLGAAMPPHTAAAAVCSGSKNGSQS